ncbi:carbamoyl phosphate synthase small subunit [Falsibacillus albus]|uniref:Carbamoyl phosphate synthase small chain n=1 Tax=Falsibacillus albus TaxID=2478915 RepID=A0A3L7K108_9BACI|nr:carbamoyl phosphate synthase small subunit [Falsibacillus albus]RLQ96079.1 carbamoyl phosphate synthase small subunit [Falsibacillus albus]
MDGFLVLENGSVYKGELIGKIQEITGELVFNTGMTGYQEMLTDPSYAGQIIVFCYPMIGNYGINLTDDESDRVQLQGVVIDEECEFPSHFRSERTFSEQLLQAGVMGIKGIDTRELVKVIRNTGTLRGIIMNKLPDSYQSIDFWEEKKSSHPYPLVEQVSTLEIKTFSNAGPHVAVMDYGYKKSIVDSLLQEGCKVTIVPYSYPFKDMLNLNPDGVLFSNGPGDPMDLIEHLGEIKKMTEHFPSLGICLGHQLIALAYGAKTSKLRFGHRGGNHPVKDLQTGKVSMTSQNHGFVVEEQSISEEIFKITHINVNDRTIEGIQHIDLPVSSVQFHPEAHPGPSDTNKIIKDFINQIIKLGDSRYAITS